MKTIQSPLNPRTVRVLEQVGSQIKLARLRRNISAEELATRAGISRKTLWNMEKGDPGVTIGNIARVLHVLGLRDDLLLLAKDDEVGRTIQDLNLRVRKRAPKRSKQEGDEA